MPTVYVTAPRDAAADLARVLVEEGLAACVNQLDCRSTYQWEGDVETADEAVLLAKTTADACPALERRIADLHPYDVPCIERFEEATVGDAFAAWRADAVDPAAAIDAAPEPESGFES